MAVAQEQAPEIVHRDLQPKAKKADLGPRAVALLEVTSAGHGTVYPIAILIDGKLYDAGAYKATPTPLALEPGTVYEGMRAGKPQGLLTISTALHGTAAGSKYPWIGKGGWLPQGATVEKTTRTAEKAPAGLDTNDAPPRLSKAGSAAEAAPSPKAPEPKPSQPGGAPGTGPPSGAAAKPESKPESKPAPTSSDDDAPVRLRRGKPTQPIAEEKDEPHGVMQTMLAISDANTSDPVSFQYEWDKTERETRRKQIVVLAQDAVRAYIKAHEASNPPPAKPAPPSARKAKASKPADMVFSNESFEARDVWRGNQPVLVYTAEAEVAAARLPNQHPDESGGTHFFVTISARSDIYGNLKQLFASVTDPAHFDVAPQLSLIDAVDVDADGRGELIFRESTGSVTGFLIYKPGGDALFKIYDSLNP